MKVTSAKIGAGSGGAPAKPKNNGRIDGDSHNEQDYGTRRDPNDPTWCDPTMG